MAGGADLNGLKEKMLMVSEDARANQSRAHHRTPKKAVGDNSLGQGSFLPASLLVLKPLMPVTLTLLL